jgi:hypothetical protein
MNHPVCIAPLMQPAMKFQSAADDRGAFKSGIKELINQACLLRLILYFLLPLAQTLPIMQQHTVLLIFSFSNKYSVTPYTKYK